MIHRVQILFVSLNLRYAVKFQSIKEIYIALQEIKKSIVTSVNWFIEWHINKYFDKIRSQITGATYF